MKLRCASVKEAEDWKEALEAESAASVDSSTVPEESSETEVLMKISLRICLVLQKCWFLVFYVIGRRISWYFFNQSTREN